MFKKLIMSCMAVAAFAAFVLPATASALNDPQLTKTGGGLASVGEVIVGTGVGTEFTTTAGANQVTCSHATLTGKVTKNSGSSVEGEIPKGSAIFSGTGPVHAHNGLNECTGAFGDAYITVTSALCLKSDSALKTDEFIVTGCTSKVKFIIGSTTAGACEYESTGSVQGDYTTGGTEAKLTVRNTSAGSGATKIGGSFLCPSSGALKMTFGLKGFVVS
jgi:hypothetical protein